jgi:hypothetical protein
MTAFSAAHASPAHPSGPGERTPLSRRVRWLALVPLAAAVMVLFGMVANWVSPELRLAAFNAALGPNAAGTGAALTALPQALGPMAVLSLPGLAFIATMLILFRLFRRLAGGHVLDVVNARLVSWAGIGFVAFAAIGTIANTLAILLLTASNPPGERVLAIGFSSGSLGALAAGLAFVALGLVLGEAARMADDHASII